MRRLILFIGFLFSISFVYGQRQLDTEIIIVRDSINLVGEWVTLESPTNDQIIQRVDGRWVNVDNALLDSVTVTDFTIKGDGTNTNPLGIDSTYVPTLYYLEDNYFAKSDSVTEFVTPSQLSDSLDIADIPEKDVYTVILPSASTIAGRISGATEGTDYPTGWTLIDDGSDLVITHDLGRRVASVDIAYTSSGTNDRHLVNFNNAYTGLVSADSDNLTIENLTTIERQIKIYILFAE